MRVLSLMSCGLGLALLVAPVRVLAQPAAVAQHTEKVKLEAPSDDELLFELRAGAVVNTGNTQSWTATTGSRFMLRRGSHGFESKAAFNVGQADIQGDMVDEYIDTARNLELKARYDYFVTEMDALFLASVYRWDTFAGLDARVQGQAGYLRNFFKEESHRFWGEAGYDITYDNFDPDPLPNPAFDPAMPVPGVPEFLDGDQIVHSARLFLGYDNHVSEAVTFLTGAEALFNVEDGEDVRLNWESKLLSKLGGGFQAEVKFTLRLDNVPVPGNEKVDTITEIAILYSVHVKDEEKPEEAAAE